MKPSFALDFRDGVIALLHRTARGWHEVGATPVDAPDLAEALSYLRSTALGLSPRGLATKLVIPNAQILYTQVHAPGPDAGKRRRQIRAALEGLTPYKVDDLVFDWWGSGSEVHVAVVARETLAEAEAFAAEHRFNPVSFVAAPEDGAYRGEPFFGASALSATLLAEGEKVERDQEPVAVVAREFPRQEPVVEVAEVAAPVAQVAEPAAEPVVEPAAEPVVEPVVEPAPEPVAEGMVAVTLPPAMAEPAPVAEAESAGPEASDHDPLPDFSAVRAPAAGVAAFDPKAMAVELVDEAPMALDVTDDAKEPSVTAIDAGPVDRAQGGSAIPKDDVPQALATAFGAAFASRRSAEQVAAAGVAAGVNGPPADFAAAAEAKARKLPAVGPAPTQRPSVPRPALAKPTVAVPRGSAVPFPSRAPAPKMALPKGKGGATAPAIAEPRRERNVVPMAKPLAAQGEAQAGAGAKAAGKGLTGLDGRLLPVRGKPRFLGLILTGILLLALAAVAFWSSFYLTSNDVGPGATPPETAVADGADATALPGNEALPSAADEALADGQDPDLVEPDLVEPETAAADPGPDPAADLAANPVDEAAPADQAATEAVTAQVPAPEPAPATGVVSDAAVSGGPANDPQDEIFLAAADTPPQTFDPTVLPQLAATRDPPPELAAPPPPFGTVYTFDAEGRIQPTPEGIITPEGVLLIAGAPKVVPPAKPAALATAPVDGTQAAAPAPDADAAPLPEVGSDPALAGKTPKARPEGLVAPDATADQQGEALAPAPDSRFANSRPQKRPDALTRTAEAVAPANEAAAASLAGNGVQASALAVAQSRRPAARPSGRDQAVDAAVAAAVQAPDPQSDPAPQAETASLAPEEQTEPEAEAPAPNLPTNASVAKQATVKDALNLSRVALIGIFGSANGRYAMIRQAGGGIRKVVVGDTIDGGRVAAISATALQYQKGGRMVTLSLPQG